ncbi:MAG: 30S ribosomal protein S4 [Candidatus Diapherotrites archaeon]|nr:30S ribosomal protein S4 [Candidatus Diapherotrites archaeon]
MGDIKKKKRKYESPRKRWDKQRIEEEREIVKRFGLKNKKELWRAETKLRKKKTQARDLLGLELEERLKQERILVDSLAKLGLLDSKAGLDDVLSIPTESLLERRLETIVWRKNLAGTVKQARQFITHGHIGINGRKINIPSYLVKKDEEDKIAYYGKEMVVQEKKKKEIKKEELTGKKSMKKDFEEAKPEEAENGEAQKGKEANKEEASKETAEKKEAKKETEKTADTEPEKEGEKKKPKDKAHKKKEKPAKEAEKKEEDKPEEKKGAKE